MPLPQTPLLTVDVVIELPARGLVLIRRKNPPHGWALPGGFVDRGESCEAAAAREAREETGLELDNVQLLGVYSDPGRDPRFHTCSVVYTALAAGDPRADDDAAGVGIFTRDTIPKDLAFDHAKILGDYFYRRRDTAHGDRARSYGVVLLDTMASPHRYLLLKKRGKDLWEFPKGRGEEGETPEQAARREVLEETGLGQLALQPAFVATAFYDRRPGSHHGRKDVMFFLAEVPPHQVPKVVLSSEHDAIGWFTTDETRGRLSRESFRQVLDVVEQFLRGRKGAGA